MKDSLQESAAVRECIGHREMAHGLQQVLARKYSRLLHAAAAEWESRFAHNDPSDACVSVRISPRDHATISSGGTRGLPAFRSQAA